MSYKKSNWVPYDPTLSFEQNVTQGGTTTADKLNNMETGISNNDINKVTDNHDGTININGDSFTPALLDSAKGKNSQPIDTDVDTLAKPGLYYVSESAPNNPFKTSIMLENRLQYDWNIFKEIQIAYKLAAESGIAVRSVYPNGDLTSVGSSEPWVFLSDDSKVAHLSGTEAVTGDKNFTGALQKDGVTVPSTMDVSTAVNQTALTAGTDVNTLTTDGVYSFSAIALTNFYNTAIHWGFIHVYHQGGLIWQIAVTAAITNGYWVRMANGSPLTWRAWTRIADDSKVAHLSGANNFDIVPTVNNNPLLLASSLPSDLARTGQDTNFTGKLQRNGKDVATTDDVSNASNTVLTSANTSISKLLQSSSNNDEDSAVTNSTSDTSNFYYWTE